MWWLLGVLSWETTLMWGVWTLQGVRTMFNKDFAAALRKKVATKGGAQKCDSAGYFHFEVHGDVFTLLAVMSPDLLTNGRLTWTSTEQNTVQVTSVCCEGLSSGALSNCMP
jgi:hypothetical protein